MKTLSVDWKKQMVITLLSALVFGFAFVALADANGHGQYTITRNETYTYTESGVGSGQPHFSGQPYPMVYPQGYPQQGVSDQLLGAGIGGGIANAKAKKHKGAWTFVGAAGGAVLGPVVIPRVRQAVDGILGGLFGQQSQVVYVPVAQSPQYFHGPVDRGPQPPQRDWRDCGQEFCTK